MMARFVVALLLAAAAHADQAARTIDRAFAKKLAALGDRALKEGQQATARRILERAVELDPDQPIARARLGFRRFGKGWKAAEPGIKGLDTDPAKALALRQELRAEEERRAATYVRGGLTEHYGKLLERLPRNEEIHKALGHERIGSRYARPELLAAARKFDEQQARWRALAAPAAVERAEMVTVKGIGVLEAYRADGLTVAGKLEDGGVEQAARTIHAAQAFHREIFGADVRTWTSAVIAFVPKEDQIRHIEALFPPGKERDAARRSGLTRSEGLVVFVAYVPAYASDVHAHAVGIYTANWIATPPHEDPEQRRRYAWFGEGMGYFASMALFRTGMTSFYGQESTTKIQASAEPPTIRDRANLLPWLQERILDGATAPLRDVFGASLNSLDLVLSLQAWSFLEFLAAYDPEGFRRLPQMLRTQEQGPYPDRTDAALRASFGKGVAELEPLWRAFVLEIM